MPPPWCKNKMSLYAQREKKKKKKTLSKITWLIKLKYNNYYHLYLNRIDNILTKGGYVRTP